MAIYFVFCPLSTTFAPLFTEDIMTQSFELIAKTFMGLEPVLAKELTQLGAENVKVGRRMVSFTGDKEMMYRANFQLHTAIRILKPIKHFKALSADDVYEGVKAVDWTEFLELDTTFAVDSVVFSEEFRHSKFVAYKVKDAIVDQFREKTGKRPNISIANPDIRLHIHIAEDQCTLCLDSSGESLHRRGYRQESVEAPLNEVLAAGMILMTGWQGDTDFIDPMCGSGTLLIEAALIARNMAPGLFRKEFAFEKWKDFDPELFDTIYNDDSQEREFTHHIYGYDVDAKAVNTARLNVRAAGLTNDITIEQRDFKEFTQPAEKSIIITNPPYGERISTSNLFETYKMIGERLKHQFTGNDAWILSYREECFEQIGLKPSIKIPLYNGSLECEFRKYQMFDGKMRIFREEGGHIKTEEEKRQMAEKRRFKQNREFKKRLEEQEENEEADIRTFRFRSLEKKPQKEREFKHRDRDFDKGERNFDRKRRDFDKKGRDFDRKGKRERDFGKKGRDFDKRKGGGSNFKKFKALIPLLILSTLLSFTHLPMTAQEKKLFTLEDLNVGGNNFRNLQPKNMWLTWWGDQLMYQDIEEGGTIDNKGNKTSVFQLKDLGEGWRTAYSAQYPYPQQTLVMLKNNKQRILYDWKKKQVAWQQTCEGETHSDWSKASKAVAYVKDDQLFVRDADDNEKQLTTDGSREIVYGQSVHRNEFGISKGTYWSPDGKRLAFYRMDQSMVADYPQVDIDPRIASYEPDKYPMAGEATHHVTIGVYDMPSGKIVYLKTPETPLTPSDPHSSPLYLTNIAWSPEAKTIYIFELNRDQNDCRLVSYDATTGERMAELYRETSEKFVEPLNPIQFLPWDADKFILQSQRDGYNHLYLYNKEGQLLKQLTSGHFVVLDMLGFNPQQKSIIIASNEASPLQRNTYAVSIATGKRTLLDNGQGVHYAFPSESGAWFYDKYTEPDVPRNIDLVQVKTGKAQRLLTAEDPWANYQQPIFENGSIKAADGQTDLYYRMVKPHDFDATKQYPTIVYVYGGPHVHNVDASWHWDSRSWETYMAQKGYILFILDNRGSGNRGRDFAQATFRQLGQIEMQDQMKGVDYLRTLPYVDMNRLGVHGWSYGGFMTISLMTTYPDVFKVGVAGGPVIDWKWYEIMYGERYMDTPQDNPEGYAKTSLLDKAKNLKGKLQIITGYNDDTVVPQHCLSFLKACIEAGTQPDFFVYPGEGHNMRGRASVHLHERITQYFEDYLK